MAGRGKGTTTTKTPSKLTGISAMLARDEVSLPFPKYVAAERRVKAQSQSATSKEGGT